MRRRQESYSHPTEQPQYLNVYQISQGADGLGSAAKGGSKARFDHLLNDSRPPIGYAAPSMKPRGRLALLAVWGLLALTAAPAIALVLVHRAAAPRPVSAISSISTHVTAPIDNEDHLYVLDGWGGVHPVGTAPALSTSAAWPTRDIAFSLALFPDGTGGYVMDGWGKLHPVGGAPEVDSGVYWPHWIGAREVVLAPWSSSDDPAGYLLDADGGIHAFGGAPSVTAGATWPGQGIARGIVLTSNSTPQSVMGYTLDGFGGVHSFGGAPAIVGNTTWPDDVARGIVLVASRGSIAVPGYTLDFSGGIHPFGGAPAVTPSALWPGQDMADSIVAWTAAHASSPGGWVLDRHGAVHPYGSAPALTPTQTWPAWDIARGLAGAGSGSGSTERTVLDPEPISDGWGAYYNQRDARWADNEVGLAGSAVWKIGCLLTDLAMVYTHFGFGKVTPASVAAHTGWFNGAGAIFNSALDIPGHTTIVKRNPDPAWIAQYLAAGHPVIVGMTLYGGGTHFVTLTGMDGSNDYWTDDPWEQNAMHVTFSGDWSDRGQIYEAIAFI